MVVWFWVVTSVVGGVVSGGVGRGAAAVEGGGGGDGDGEGEEDEKGDPAKDSFPAEAFILLAVFVHGRKLCR